MERLVGLLPEEWPDRGWRALVEEDVGRKLPVEPWLYHQLMSIEPDKWKDQITEASGPLPSFISICLDMVRYQVQWQSSVHLKYCAVMRVCAVEYAVMCTGRLHIRKRVHDHVLVKSTH